MTIDLAFAAAIASAAAVFLLIYTSAGPLRRRFASGVERRTGVYREWSLELFLDWSTERARRMVLLARAAIVVTVVVTWLVTASTLFAAAAALAVYWAPSVLYRIAREQRRTRIEEQLPDAVGIMVASVRTGSSLSMAIKDASEKMPAPVGQELQFIWREHRTGGLNIEQALERASKRLQLESFSMIAGAMGIASREGGDLLQVLQHMSEAIRELSRLKAKIVAETSEVRAQEKVVIAMTPLFLIGACMFDPSVPELLFNSWQGHLLLIIMVVLQTISIFWIRSIVRSTI